MADQDRRVARVLGGPGGARADNIVAILSKVNRGDMRLWEGQIKTLLEKGYNVQVRIRPIYDGSGTVPSQIEYSYRVIGARVPWLTKTFDNK